jgi:hypothetical protein
MAIPEPCFESMQWLREPNTLMEMDMSAYACLEQWRL